MHTPKKQVEERLLEDINEWKHVPEIVRLTLKSISDVVRSQGIKIEKLEDFLYSRKEHAPPKASEEKLNFLQKSFDELLQRSPSVSDIDHIYKLLDSKADVSDLSQSHSWEINRMRSETFDALNKFEEKLNDFSLNQSHTHRQIEETLLDSFSIQLGHLKTSMNAETSELKQYYLSKTSEVLSKLENKIDIDYFCERLSAQAQINETLCSENCLGRWIWKSLPLINYKVPWCLESANTCPENFEWSPNQPYILTHTPGLYELTIGFFARGSFSVALYVNEEQVMTKDFNHKITHSSGNVMGLTAIEFLALPSKATVSCSLKGDEFAEGFLGLKKL